MTTRKEVCMSRRLAVRLAPLLALAAGIAAIAASTGGAQTPTGRTITLVEKDQGGTFAFVDNAPKARNPRSVRPSAGDQLVFTTSVFDALGTTRQGAVTVTCTFARPARDIERAPVFCSGVYALKDGTIVASGIVDGVANASVDRLAIVGGTGAYVGARGTLTTTDTKAGSNDTIELLP
jgi:hypothetical protein